MLRYALSLPVLPVFPVLTFLTVLGIGCAATSPQPGRAEVPPEATLPCFPGAYYRKAVSSVDRWTGLDAVIVLPTPTFDPNRRRPANPAQFLDNPSVYVGGRWGADRAAEGREVDAGLTWEVVRLPDGRVSADRRAFRPFWRTAKWHSAPAHPSLYFYPGDTVRISIITPERDKLVLRISLFSRGPSGSAAFALYPTPSAPPTLPPGVSLPQPNTLEVTFDAPGFDPDGVQEFKRVNAIDQVGREGNAVDPTTTTVVLAEWKRVHLLRGNDRLPFTPSRFTDMRCPATMNVSVTPLPHGGEKITLRGTP